MQQCKALQAAKSKDIQQISDITGNVQKPQDLKTRNDLKHDMALTSTCTYVVLVMKALNVQDISSFPVLMEDAMDHLSSTRTYYMPWKL